jgi:hypothetical protein
MTKRDFDLLKERAERARDLTGSWRRGMIPDTVVCDKNPPGSRRDDHLHYYGGVLLAESIICDPVTQFIATFDPAIVLELLEHVDRKALPE